VSRQFVPWKYKQVRFKEGGGIRDILITEDENISVDSLIEKGKNSFFLVETARRACSIL
jgi:hypothetical protein